MPELKIVNNKQTLDDQVKEVLDFLNVKANKRFRLVDVNIAFIKARLKSNMEVSDLKAIIAMKVRESNNGEFNRKYLRPATLFNLEKCEQYFGELE